MKAINNNLITSDIIEVRDLSSVSDCHSKTAASNSQIVHFLIMTNNLSFFLAPSLTYGTASNTLLLHALFTNIHVQYFGEGLVSLVHSDDKSTIVDAILKVVSPVVVMSGYQNPVFPKNTEGVIVVGDTPWVPDDRTQAPVLIITEEDNPAHIKTWLQRFWREHRLTDVVVMVVNNQTSFFTFFPFDTQCGDDIEPVEVNLTDLYPKKFDGNLNLCPIRVISDWIMPYVAGHSESPESLGVEDRIFSEIVRKLNGTVQEVMLPEGQSPQLTRNASGHLTGGAHLLRLQQVTMKCRDRKLMRNINLPLYHSR